MKKKSKERKALIVDKFVEILKMARDTDIAPISFWVDDQELELESLGQMGLLADVSVNFKNTTPSIMQPAVFQRSNQKMADAKMREIQEDLKKKKK